LVLIGEIAGVVVLVGLAAAVLLRRRSHDDVHSVEHYHRQLHTLSEMQAHLPSTEPQNGNDQGAFPASAFKVSGTSTVRLTEPGLTPVPPVPPPPVAKPSEPVTFEDSDLEMAQSTFMSGAQDRVMESINNRPRRLAAPAAAIAAVTVLIVVLIVTGLHSNSPPHHANTGATATSQPHAGTHARNQTTTTTSTAPTFVSAPQAGSPHTASYQVAATSYSLSFAATTGECWVEATNTATGSVLFTAILFSGQSHTIAATGPVTVIAGAPAAFSATINGSAVSLPSGYQAPFTLSFQTAAASA
jgi:hypothetical protein